MKKLKKLEQVREQVRIYAVFFIAKSRIILYTDYNLLHLNGENMTFWCYPLPRLEDQLERTLGECLVSIIYIIRVSSPCKAVNRVVPLEKHRVLSHIRIQFRPVFFFF